MEIYEYSLQVMPRKKEIRFSQRTIADAVWMNTGLYRRERSGGLYVIPYQGLGRVLRGAENNVYRLYLVRKDASYVRASLKKFLRENGLEEYLEALAAAPLEDKGEAPESEAFSKEEMAAVRKHDRGMLREQRDE